MTQKKQMGFQYSAKTLHSAIFEDLCMILEHMANVKLFKTNKKGAHYFW